VMRTPYGKSTAGSTATSRQAMRHFTIDLTIPLAGDLGFQILNLEVVGV